MNTYTEHIKSVIQIRINSVDRNMEIYDLIINALDSNHDVRCIRKTMTPETPISIYKYKNIPFYVLFDEFTEETFISIEKEYNYKLIEMLLEGIELMSVK